MTHQETFLAIINLVLNTFKTILDIRSPRYIGSKIVLNFRQKMAWNKSWTTVHFLRWRPYRISLTIKRLMTRRVNFDTVIKFN